MEIHAAVLNVERLLVKLLATGAPAERVAETLGLPVATVRAFAQTGLGSLAIAHERIEKP